MINRTGTLYDINNLVEDTYEHLYKNITELYEAEQQENEKLKQQNQELLRFIQNLRFEDVLEEMNETINIKLYKIKEILKKYNK